MLAQPGCRPGLRLASVGSGRTSSLEACCGGDVGRRRVDASDAAPSRSGPLPPRAARRADRRTGGCRCRSRRVRRSRERLEPVRVDPAARSRLGGEDQEDLVTFGMTTPSTSTSRSSRPEEGLHGRSSLIAVESDVGKAGLGTQLVPLVGLLDKLMDDGAEPVDGGVDPGRQERAHHQRCHLRSDVRDRGRPDVGLGPDLGERLPSALRC